MYRVIGCLVGMVFGLSCSSALALEGIVLAPDGTFLGDATVSILGRPGTARTGPDGTFRWASEPTLPFEVLVRLPGGAHAWRVPIETLPPGPEPMVVRLREELSESVTVDAGATPYTAALPASAVTVLERKDLEERHPGTLTEAIESIPGTGRLEEGHSAVPSIRGLARGRTLLLVDGARVTAERRAGPSATYLDAFFVEAIEVSRGLGGVAYGSDAFGGIIQARTREAVPGSPLTLRTEATLGTGLPERSLGAELSRGFEQGSLILQGRLRDSGDYRSGQGRIANSGFGDGGFRGRLERRIGSGRANLGWESDRGWNIGKPSSDSDQVRAFYPREESQRLTIGYEGEPSRGIAHWSAQAFLGSYRLLTVRDRAAAPSRGRQTDSTDVGANDYGLRLSGRLSVRDWSVESGIDLNGRTGLEAVGRSERFDSSGSTVSDTSEISVRDASRHDLGAYASVSRGLARRLWAAGGLRFDQVIAENRGGFFGDRTTFQAAPSGFIALTLGPVADFTITGQAGAGFRAPTLSDRYFRGVSGRGFVTGLPDLRPERSRQYDLVVRRSGAVRTAVSLYRYRISDLVERYRSGDDYFFRNRGQARIQGAELEAAFDIGRGFAAEVGAQVASGRSEQGGPLADIPPMGFTFTLRKRLGARGDAVLRGVFRGRDEKPGPTEKPIAGYGTLEGAVAWRLGSRLEARFVVKNLLDHEYLQTSDELSVLAPGRSAAIKLTTTF
jgi:iron complex outermembrane receptor protein